MARKKRSPSPPDAAGPSRPPKKTKSTSRSSENSTDCSRLELDAMYRKRIEELQIENNELKEKLNRLQNPNDTNQLRSEQVDHDQYELKLHDAVKKRVYTDSKVEGQHGELLKVTICCNGEKITSGPLASANFEILVVKGGFCASSQGGWSADAFQESLVEAREEVGPIIKDGYVSEFANGEAVLDGLVFKDNSSWVKGKKWRLGIRLLESNGIRVLEAISSCIRVLDRHGKEKPHPPLLTDDVEKLEKVGKKRAFDLKKKKICTIKDFLQIYHRKPSRLLKILRINSESDKSWDTMTEHAKECEVGSSLYSFRKKTTMLFFNSVYELVGAEFGNCYRSYDKLPHSKKILVDKWKKGFDKNINLRNTNLTADFEMVNPQPVPIEHDFTGISTDDVAPQHDQTASLQDTQPADVTLASDGQMWGTETDADQNVSPDHNTARQYNCIHDQSSGVQERQPDNANMNLSYSNGPLSGTTDADPNDRPGHSAAQHYNLIQDPTAGVQDQQPVNAYDSFFDSSDQLLDTETGAGQNPEPDHNTTDRNNLIPAGVQERQNAGVITTVISLDDPLLLYSPLIEAEFQQWMAIFDWNLPENHRVMPQFVHEGQLLDTETDAGQNLETDQNTTDHNYWIQAGVQEIQNAGVNTIVISLDGPPHSPADSEAEFQRWLTALTEAESEAEYRRCITALAARKAISRLRGCTLTLLLYKRVIMRRERHAG